MPVQTQTRANEKTLLPVSAALCILLGGCTNPYKEYFIPELTPMTDEKNLVYLREGEKPVLERTDDLEKAVYDALAPEFVCVGRAGFTGAPREISLIAEQAKDIRATHVIYNVTCADTRSGVSAIPVPDYKVTNTSGTVSSPYGHFANYQASTTTTGTKYIPYTCHVDRYDQIAYFFVKSLARARFGVWTKDLTNEERERIGQNNGARIALVTYDRPAFNANVLKNDILPKINDIAIRDARRHAGDIMKNDTGKKVTFTVFRKNPKIVIPITLDSPPAR